MAGQRSDGGRGWIYDVFLSFRGEDTRKNFTDHLYYGLADAGIDVFRDDSELQRGENITVELERAIQGSKIAVVVFSQNYAHSRWCLEELVKIMDCRKTMNQMVLPIFYDVDPSDVRNQKGSFEDAFARHQQRFVFDNDKILKWKMALTEAATLSGWDLRNVADGHEGKFIKSIVENIMRDLNGTYLSVAPHAVGIDSRVNAITSKLVIGSSGVLMVGIWGMGGLGKTTIAKAVYNKHYHDFEGACFLDNIKDTSKESGGTVRLQEQLLRAIFKSRQFKLESIDQGITQVKKSLCHKKILLVLDDIDDISQLNALARSRDWFSAGSRIIITTKDEHLLNVLKVDVVCKVGEMDYAEGLELFSWYAFHNSYPSEDYRELSKRVVDYCGGLPLALEVLGSFLCDRTIEEWEDALNKLKRIPDNKIQGKLEISYDSLDDQTYKDIFLDISCFFIGMDKNEVTQILDGCGFFATIGIRVLLQRCLIKIDKENKITMHDLVRDMGREIVRKVSPREPEKRSRLFLKDEVLDVFNKQKKTEIIEGLSLKLSKSSKIFLHTRAFVEMQKLRLLRLNYANIKGCFEHLSYELRWLCWHGFPLKFLPKTFNLEKVVSIDLRYSQLRAFSTNSTMLEKLTILNLSYSHHLTKTPDFLKLPNLEKLKLKDCKNLVAVDDSIGSLTKLVFLNLKGCIWLNKLPMTLSNLRSLETLILSGCSRLETLLEDLGKMESLTTLVADDTQIQQLPSTIVRLKKLKYLSLSRCKGPSSKSLGEILWSLIFSWKYVNSIVLPTSLQGLESLTTLCLKSCNLSNDANLTSIGDLVSLVELDLRDNGFHSLPTSISCLSKLEILCLDDCTKLKQIPTLPPNLKRFNASRCKVLESISGLSKYIFILQVDDCPNLVEISRLDKLLPFIFHIRMERSRKLMQSFRENILQGWTITGLCIENSMASALKVIGLPIHDYRDDLLYLDEGIRNDIFLHRSIIMSDGLTLYVKASQNVNFDLEGLIYMTRGSVKVFYSKGVIPSDEALTLNDAVNSILDEIWEDEGAADANFVTTLLEKHRPLI